MEKIETTLNDSEKLLNLESKRNAVETYLKKLFFGKIFI